MESNDRDVSRSPPHVTSDRAGAPSSTHAGRSAGALLVAFILLLATGGVAALSVTLLGTERLSVSEVETATTDLKVTEYTISFTGEQEVRVETKVMNRDSVAHAGDLAVFLLDANGDVLVTETKSTGTVAADGKTVKLVFDFQQSGLVDAYAETYMVVHQTS